MMPDVIRACPICSNSSSEPAFPWAIQFEGKRFGYYKCIACSSVFVDPVPDAQTFARMYAKSDYHDCHYSECESTHYEIAAKLLGGYLPIGASILDYGCGFGHFLGAVQAAGYRACGVEFDSEAAAAASRSSGCEVFSIEEFSKKTRGPKFDLIHLGDVLEHLPEPSETLKQLLTHLKSGGLLFVEGPLETNPSPVYWATRLFATIKRRLRPGFIGKGKPTHLFRTGARQQLDFFCRVAPNLQLLHWEIYETGWPYADSGVIKNSISKFSNLLGGKTFFCITFGNRFKGIFRYTIGQPD